MKHSVAGKPEEQTVTRLLFSQSSPKTCKILPIASQSLSPPPNRTFNKFLFRLYLLYLPHIKDDTWENVLLYSAYSCFYAY